MGAFAASYLAFGSTDFEPSEPSESRLDRPVERRTRLEDGSGDRRGEEPAVDTPDAIGLPGERRRGIPLADLLVGSIEQRPVGNREQLP